MGETVWTDAEIEEQRQRAIEQNGELSGDPGPGSLYCHEALHMTSFLCSAIDTELCGHPAIASNPEWHRMAMAAHQKLADLYQMIGAAHLDDPAPSLSRVNGRGGIAMAKPIPAYTFIEPWNPLSCCCKLAIGGEVYDVVRWTMPVRVVRYTARKNGVVIAERAKFTSLLRDLGKLSSPTPLAAGENAEGER